MFVGPFLWIIVAEGRGISRKVVWAGFKKTVTVAGILITLLGASFSAFSFYSSQSLDGIQLLCADTQIGHLQDPQGNILEHFPTNVTLRVGLYNPSLEQINGTWIVVVNLVTNGTILNRLPSTSPISFILSPQGKAIFSVTFSVAGLTLLHGNTTVAVIDLSEKYTVTGLSLKYISWRLSVLPLTGLLQRTQTRLTSRNPGFSLANSPPNQVNEKAVGSLSTALTDIVLILWLRQSNTSTFTTGCYQYTQLSS